MKPVAPGSIFYHISFQSTFICIFTFPIYIIKYKKYIYLIILSLSDLTFASGREGINNPFIALVASGCYLCAGVVYVVLLGSPTGSITLVSSLREIPTVAMLHHPFIFEEIPT